MLHGNNCRRGQYFDSVPEIFYTGSSDRDRAARYRDVVFADGPESFADKPDESESVWRYMDLARYLSLLQSSALHFARADQMTDRWEGSTSDATLVAKRQLYGDELFNLIAPGGAHDKRRKNTFRMMVFMNCWHVSDHESAAMWEIYQRAGLGVAVQSTWGALTRSIGGDREVYGARVNYVDYKQAIIRDNVAELFLHKRRSFAHEQEARLMIIGTDAVEGADSPKFITVPVDLGQLVQQVFVAPEAPEWVRGVIEQTTKVHGFDFPVVQSDLVRDPID